MTREDAWALLTEYNQEPFHLKHAQIVEGAMRYFAQELGYGSGRVLGRHAGIIHYTIGQRRGLGISAKQALYVCALSAEDNTVTLGSREKFLPHGQRKKAGTREHPC